MWRLIAFVSVMLVLASARPSIAAVAPGRVVFSVGELASPGTFQDTGGAWRAVALPDGGAVLVAPDPMGFVAARIRADGSLDGSFGTGGVTHIAVPHGGESPLTDPHSFAPVQVLRSTDGRLVVVGEQPSAVVVRLSASGALDPTFGEGGIARLDLAAGAVAALQPDGALVMSGTAWSSETGFRWVVARLGADGRLDPGFGRAGVFEVPGTSMNGGGTAAGLLSDGRIVAYGRGPAAAMLIRLTPAGVPDLSFHGGVPVVPPNGGFGMAVQPDGAVVLLTVTPALENQRWSLVRYRSDGERDLTFGQSGTVLLPPDANYGLAPVADGRVLVHARPTT